MSSAIIIVSSASVSDRTIGAQASGNRMIETIANAAICYAVEAPDVDVLHESVHSMPVTRWRAGRGDQGPHPANHRKR